MMETNIYWWVGWLFKGVLPLWIIGASLKALHIQCESEVKCLIRNTTLLGKK